MTDAELFDLAEHHQRAMTDGEIWARFIEPSPDLTMADARILVSNLIYDELRAERDGTTMAGYETDPDGL